MNKVEFSLTNLRSAREELLIQPRQAFAWSTFKPISVSSWVQTQACDWSKFNSIVQFKFKFLLLRVWTPTGMSTEHPEELKLSFQNIRRCCFMTGSFYISRKMGLKSMNLQDRTYVNHTLLRCKDHGPRLLPGLWHFSGFQVTSSRQQKYLEQWERLSQLYLPVKLCQSLLWGMTTVSQTSKPYPQLAVTGKKQALHCCRRAGCEFILSLV